MSIHFFHHTINLVVYNNVGQFWSTAISSQPYIGDTTGLVPGYDPYTIKVEHP